MKAVFFYFRNEIAYFLFIVFLYYPCSFLATQPSETLTLKKDSMWRRMLFPMNSNYGVRKLFSK